MPTVATMLKGDDFAKTLLDDVLAMISERRTKAGLSAATWSQLYNTATNPQAPQGEDISTGLINFLRGKLEGAIPSYLNTAIHTGGSIEGASTVTNWTKSTVLTAANVGGIDGFFQKNWTNVPPSPDGDAQDLSDFVSNLYGTNLIQGPSLYRVWLNELVAICRKLTHIVIFVTPPAFNSTMTGKRTRTTYVYASMSELMDCIQSKHPNTAYSSFMTVAKYFDECTLLQTTNSGGSFNAPIRVHEVIQNNFGSPVFDYADVGLENIKGRYTANLSNISSGTAKFYLATSPGPDGESNTPPVATDSKYHEKEQPTVGAGWTSNWYGDVDAVFSVDGSEAIIKGWQIDAVQLIAAPTFQYT